MRLLRVLQRAARVPSKHSRLLCVYNKRVESLKPNNPKRKRVKRMTITEMTLTDEEVNQAIQDFLGWRGMKVVVKNLEGKGYPRRGWEVCIEATLEPRPPITTPEELGEAIEKGTL